MNYRPTDKEIQEYISAWDGDISDKEARYLLEINHYKAEIEKLQAVKDQIHKSSVTTITLMDDTICQLEDKLKAKDEEIERGVRMNKRLMKALKEQGFKVGPFVDGPDIRD